MLTDYEKRVLEGTPERALLFMRGVSTKVEIRAALMQVGYSEDEQAEGWRLLLDASGYRPEQLTADDDRRVRAAIAEIDGWDEQAFRRIAAALGRLHPEQNEFVFAGLNAQRGVGALVSVSTLLDRLDALESGEARPDSREADLAAIATLEKRGIGRAARNRMRELLAIAQAAHQPVVLPEQPLTPDREQALRALRAWYMDWAQTARAVIQRRDYLIMLGLSRRRRGTAIPGDDGESIDAAVADVVHGAAQ